MLEESALRPGFFQHLHPGILPDLLESAYRYTGVLAGEAARRAAEVLAALDIAHLAEKPPLALSGGEKRLAAIVAEDPPGELFADAGRMEGWGL
jgi:ABC-type arginine transport system ATPase subunit